jgi:FKBP-type peptidyl-prolyl cis-trans isomerase
MLSRTFFPVAAAALTALVVASCGYPDPTPSPPPGAGVAQNTPTPAAGGDDFNAGSDRTAIKFPDGLQIVDLTVGTGQIVPVNSTVTVQYTGWLSDGTQFDTSRQAGRDPLCAILVNTQSTVGNCTPVIPGWNEAVPGMRVGGKRKMTLPPDLAYGAQGSPPTIPANATLVFTVEVLSIVTTATPPPSTPAPSPT